MCVLPAASVLARTYERAAELEGRVACFEWELESRRWSAGGRTLRTWGSAHGCWGMRCQTGIGYQTGHGGESRSGVGHREGVVAIRAHTF